MIGQMYNELCIIEDKLNTQPLTFIVSVTLILLQIFVSHADYKIILIKSQIRRFQIEPLILSGVAKFSRLLGHDALFRGFALVDFLFEYQLLRNVLPKILPFENDGIQHRLSKNEHKADSHDTPWPFFGE